MIKSKYWFTLIEIIVWTTISIIIMISIWTFAVSWIKNITFQKQVLSQDKESLNIKNDFENIFSSDIEIVSSSNSWIILLSNNFLLWKPLIYDFSIKTLTWECKNDENIQTKYLTLKNYNPVELVSWFFTWSSIKNEIYKNSTKVIWKWYFWDNFYGWINWLEALLNNPMWLTNNINIAYISDTANNRILYYSWSKLYSLLDESFWIYKPTWLLYSNNELFILNNFWTQILSFSSKPWIIKPIDIDFIADKDIIFDKVSLTLSGKLNINWSYNTWSFIFSWITNKIDDSISINPWRINYIFSWSQNISSWSNIWIKIPSFNWSFNWFWSTYIDLTFYNWLNGTYQKLYPYAINSDNDLPTTFDNDLKILTWWLNGLFTNISQNIIQNLIFKDFVNKKQLTLSKTWSFISSWNLLDSDVPSFDSINSSYDLKIKDFKVDNSSWILNLKIDYYKNFDCFNEKDNIIKSIILKKNISN